MTMIKLNEIFKSIQGEGPKMGHPALFIRFAGCPLKCQWKVDGKIIKCDTQYAAKFGSMHLHEFTVNNYISSRKDAYKDYIAVITGGEPAIQPLAVSHVAGMLEGKCKCVDIETSGILPDFSSFPTWTLSGWISMFDQYIISPKLETIDNLPILSEAHDEALAEKNINPLVLKIVYDGDKYNEDFINECIEKCPATYTKDNIYIMSAGVTIEDLIKQDKVVVELCKKNGWMFSPRMQIYLYGNQRGK